MFEVKSRSVESWGPLANVGDREFKNLINQLHAKDAIKTHLKKAKKLKTYKVTFEKRWRSEQFEIKAESDWDIGSAARAYFKEHGEKIGFKEQERSKWAGGDDGYDAISYVKVRS